MANVPSFARLRQAWRDMRFKYDLGRKQRLNRSHALQQDQAPLIFVIEADNVGLFAHLTWCIHLADWGTSVGRRPAFVCSSANYRDPEGPANWLPTILSQPQFVAPEQLGEVPGARVIRLKNLLEFPFWKDQPRPLSLAIAREHFRERFRLSAEVRSEVETVSRAWAGQFIVGVHYRGTDKSSEAPPVDPQVAVSHLKMVAAALRDRQIPFKIFVATDEASFIERMNAELGELVINRSHVARSRDGHPVHHANPRQRGMRNAIDAMVDAVLLSQCQVLIRTASFLSGWSALLAQSQLVFMLNRPHRQNEWFPDSEILKTCASLENVEEELDNFIKAHPMPARLALAHST